MRRERRGVDELLNRRNLFAVGEALEEGDLSFDLLHKFLPFRGLQGVQELLDHIVAILVTNQRQRRTFALVIDGGHSSHNLLPFLLRAEFDALFDDITGEFML